MLTYTARVNGDIVAITDNAFPATSTVDHAS